MKAFVPYDKLSKRDKRAIDGVKRKDWGAVDPRTRVHKNPKAYNRSKARRWKEENPHPGFWIRLKIFL